MTPSQQRRVLELFRQAEELPPAERERFLAELAGADGPLAAEVRRLLLLADETPEDFLAATRKGPADRDPAGAVSAGVRLGPYRLEAPLAAGGMGEIWRAVDTRLGREVAVKVLPPERDPGGGLRRRFEREARAAAALSHPNIVALFDFGRSGEVCYAVSELLEGETLRARIERGPLPVRAAIECALDIARALAAAHGKGIVHRDLKPENVFMTADGRVKLLDFGIAAWGRRPEPPSAAARTGGAFDTAPGTMLGTPSYMAPEQVRGELPDPRLDLFALGCVLYEVLSGQRAFEGETLSEILDAILFQEPAPLAVAGEEFAALDRIARQCLQKDPHLRPPSAAQLVAHLEELLEDARAQDYLRLSGRDGGTRPAARLMLAVLPFEGIGGDAQQELFADGLTEEMITVLGRAGSDRLGVIARTSAMQFKGQRVGVERIGRALGVDYVIEGSVRREGNRTRIAAKLIQVADQTQLWSDSFDGDVGDILSLQADVTRRVAQALSLELVPRFHAAGRASTTDPRAYAAYLAGRAAFYRASEEGWRLAISHQERAVTIDPDFALAHAAIASGYTALALWGAIHSGRARAGAAAAVARAQALEPDLVEVHATLAMSGMFLDWRWDAAGGAFERALALNPSDGEVYHWYAHYLLFVGRPREAADAFAQAKRHDPLSTFHLSCLGGHHVVAHELDRGEAVLRVAAAEAPDGPLAHHYLGWLLERRGRIDDAIAAWEQAARVSDSAGLLATVGYGYARAGREADARRVADELERRARREYIAGLHRAKVFAGLGQLDEAFAWLERSFRERDAWLAALELEPGLDALRGDSRYVDLLRRVGVTPVSSW